MARVVYFRQVRDVAERHRIDVMALQVIWCEEGVFEAGERMFYRGGQERRAETGFLMSKKNGRNI